MPRTERRGGPRQGQPGKTYGNRKDLGTGARKVMSSTGPSKVYGQGVQRQQSLQAVPLVSPAAPAGPLPAGAAAGEAPSYPLPGSFGPLDRPTERPGEPLTTGLPTGPGAGPEILGIGDTDPDTELRAIYLQFPSEDLRELLERR